MEFEAGVFGGFAQSTRSSQTIRCMLARQLPEECALAGRTEPPRDDDEMPDGELVRDEDLEREK